MKNREIAFGVVMTILCISFVGLVALFAHHDVAIRDRARAQIQENLKHSAAVVTFKDGSTRTFEHNTEIQIRSLNGKSYYFLRPSTTTLSSDEVKFVEIVHN